MYKYCPKTLFVDTPIILFALLALGCFKAKDNLFQI